MQDKEQTVAELLRLESAVGAGLRAAIEALKQIHDLKLYRFSDLDGSSWENYLQKRWHRTRQWAQQEFDWLTTVETAASHGIDISGFPHSTARGFAKFLDDPVKLRAKVDEFRKAKGKKKKKKATAKSKGKAEPMNRLINVREALVKAEEAIDGFLALAKDTRKANWLILKPDVRKTLASAIEKMCANLSSLLADGNDGNDEA